MPNAGFASAHQDSPAPGVAVAVDLRRQDAALSRALSRLSGGGIVVGHCRIEAGQEFALMPEEAAAFATAVPLVRRRSAAARQVARRLLERLGAGSTIAIPRGARGAPAWPAGVVGSLAHDHDFAVAALARSDAVRGLGIDIEPAEPLPPGLADHVASASELGSFDGHEALAGRALFVAKEAVFKATHPHDGVFLDFADIVVDLATGRATTTTGHVLRVDVVVAGRIVALARW